MAEAVQPTPYIGRSLRRREDYKFLTGKGRYVDDIKLSGTLHLAILRSPHAHAVITGMTGRSGTTVPGMTQLSLMLSILPMRHWRIRERPVPRLAIAEAAA
jgi:CO/xanthine dehydrogenase Mo-binding subunit